MTTELIYNHSEIPSLRPVISICIPSYSHAAYVRECIASIKSLNRKDQIEVVIIDDCSPDSTVSDALDELRQSGLSYYIYKNARNMGLNFNLNFLLERARGKYLIFCGSDDKLCPIAIEQIIFTLDLNPIRAFTVYSAMYFGRNRGLVYSEKDFEIIFSDIEKLYYWISTNIPKPLLLQSTVFNAEFLRELSPWKDQLLLDDWPTFIRAIEKAIREQLKINYSKEILLEYRVHDGGMHRNVERQRRACIEVVDRVISPSHRKIALSNVYLEFSSVNIACGKLICGLSDYLMAIKLNPALKTFVSLPVAVLNGILRRLRRMYSRNLRIVQ
jgi:glycosyltransferase involved in cell wall biosynthesis